MTRAHEFWSVLFKNMPLQTWISLQEIYALIETKVCLDDEDFEPQSPSSDGPKWKRNVRNVLQEKKGMGLIEWRSRGQYRLI